MKNEKYQLAGNTYIRHDGKLYKSGDIIELTAAQASRLKDILAPVVTQPAVKSATEKTTADGKTTTVNETNKGEK